MRSHRSRKRNCAVSRYHAWVAGEREIAGGRYPEETRGKVHRHSPTEATIMAFKDGESRKHRRGSDLQQVEDNGSLSSVLQAENTSITCLPKECLSSILKLLSIRERLEAEKVSTYFGQAARISWSDQKVFRASSSFCGFPENEVLKQSTLETILQRCGAYLTTFSCRQFGLGPDVDVCKLLTYCGPLVEVELEVLTSSSDVLQALAQHSTTLRRLHFDNEDYIVAAATLENDLLLRCVNIQDLQISGFDLRACRYGSWPFAKQLTKLELTCNSTCFHRVVSALADFTSLTTLRFTWQNDACRCERDGTIYNVNRSITCLELGNNRTNLTDYHLQLLASITPNVSRLNIADCNSLTDNMILQILRAWPLEHLDLSTRSYASRVDSKFLKSAGNLRSLNLSGCCRLNDVYVSAFVSSTRALQSINISRCLLIVQWSVLKNARSDNRPIGSNTRLKVFVESGFRSFIRYITGKAAGGDDAWP